MTTRATRAIVAACAVLGVAASFFIGQGGVGAVTPVSQSSGGFLSGTALSTDLASLVALQNAAATNSGTPALVQDAHPLDVTALSLIPLDLGGGLQLLQGATPLVALGAANQYANAANDGASYAASGAVTNAGAVGVGAGGVPQGNATINLTSLTNTLGLAGSVSNASIGVGAVAGTATQTAGGLQSGTYQIAGLGLDVTSPLVGGLVTTLSGAIAPVQTLLNGLTGTLSALLCPGSPPLPCLLSVTAPNLQDTVNALTTISLAGGSLVVDLTNGHIALNVDNFLTFHGIDLNSLPANSDLTAVIDPLLSSDLLTGLTATLTTLTSDLVTAINGTTVTLAGVPINAGTLAAALAPIVTALTAALTPVTSSLGGTIVDPLIAALDQLVRITINKQATSAGTFTETPIALAVVPATPLVSLNLASASVGPNGGPLAPPPAPTALGLNPNQGPTAGGQTVTMTGSNFVVGATSVTIGGIAIPAGSVTVAPGGASLTFVTPPHAAGPVSVTATTVGGTTAPLTYTYVPPVVNTPTPPTALSLDPNHGPEAGGTTVTVSGSHFVVGQTTVTIGGIHIPASEVTVAPNGNSLTFVTPPHAAGDVSVTVTTPAGTSGPLTYTYDPDVTPTPQSAGQEPVGGSPQPAQVQPQQAGEMASTGADPWLPLMLALFAIAAGVLLMVGAPMATRESR